MDQRRLLALNFGATRFNGEPCKYGHGTERYAQNGGCVACVSRRAARHNERVRQVLRERKAARKAAQGELKDKLAAGKRVDRETAREAGLKIYLEDGYCEAGHMAPFRDVVTGSCMLCKDQIIHQLMA